MRECSFVLAFLLFLSGCAAAPPGPKFDTVVFYPAPPQKPRLQFLRSISVEEDLGAARSAFQEFLLGKQPVERSIVKPYDIASSPGKIYVLDRSLRKLAILDLARRTIDYLPDRGPGALIDPSGIWVGPDDVKYVADMKRKQVVVFSPDNAYTKAYGDGGTFEKPVDVAVFQDRVYVCDMGRNQIFALDKNTGEVKMTIGRAGTETGELNRPSHVVVDSKGHIFVNDAFNFRVQQFDSSGTFVRSYGFPGDNLGGFARPKGLDIDREGHLFVADAAFENVQIFDEKTGLLLLFFGGPGAGPGDMFLPSGVHIDYVNAGYFSRFAERDFRLEFVVYVGNTFGADRLNVYGFGEWVGEEIAETQRMKEIREDTQDRRDVKENK
jgi:DNA-binding beta-propeller fold protein YncE